MDPSNAKQLVKTFAWDGTRYAEFDDDDIGAAAWMPFLVNRHRTKAQFVLTDAMKMRLNDLGVMIAHPTVGPLSLPQIYVFPDLRESPISAVEIGHKGSKTIRGEDVVSFLLGRQGHTLVIGDSDSGKTSLAKMLMLKLIEHGQVPILISGKERLASGDDLARVLEDTFVAQYDTPTRQAYRQLAPTQRIVIIDDYHALALSKGKRRRLLEDLESFASRIVLIGHDIIMGIEGIAQADPLDSVYSYRIQPFGHVRRNQIVEKWLLLGDNVDVDTAPFVRSLASITRQLDDIIGKNYVPSYPSYVLSVLQAAEAATPIDIRACTYGYFYELFIRTQLARGRTSVQYDILTAYLAHLAFQMFETREVIARIARVREWHEAYEHRYAQRLEFESLLNKQLVAQRILDCTNDEVSFSYKYLYYYFVASYMRDHLSEPAMRQTVERLSLNLHVEENANILLFLAHLSRDPVIIEAMLSAARGCYADVSPARLDDDLAFLEDIEALASELTVYRDSDPLKERAAISERFDEDGDQTPEFEAQIDPGNPIVRLGIALRTLQILGQIAKNFPGSIVAEKKTEIVEECIALGLRALGWVFSVMERTQLSFIQECVFIIGRQHPRYALEELVERARKVAVSLAAVASFGMVKRVSTSIGSKDLAETFRGLPDRQAPIRRLIHLSIDLDVSGEFPMAELREAAMGLRKKPMAGWVLRQLATQHIRLFQTSYTTKQRVCTELGITFEQLEASEQPKLLKG